MPFPDWSITTRLDAMAHWQTVRRAVKCHRSQLPTLPDMDQLSEEQHRLFWGQPTLYRVYSFVNAGRSVEHDLFAGLR
jgi:LmbE family N-acetylglucosaminyl deacetylase